MSNFRKVISMSAVAMLGVTNLLTPLSYASAATKYHALTGGHLEHTPLIFEMPDHDVSLYARTAANRYYVEYSGHGSTAGSMDTTGFYYDTTGYLDELEYTRTGYTFTNWNTDPNGGGESYANKAKVRNWTGADEVTIPIYAQWNANHYNISYNLNDTTGSSTAVAGTRAPTSGTYDEDVYIDHPSRTGYAFSGWNITNMNAETNLINDNPSHATSVDNEESEKYKNLRTDDEVAVNFLATWNATLTDYIVKHFKQDLSGNYAATPDLVTTGSAPTDSIATGALETFEGFTAPAEDSTTVTADGNAHIDYNYTRNPYNLTLKASTGIASATAAGTVSTPALTVSAGESSSKEFKYEEPMTLTFTLKDGYENGTWTGSAWTGSAANNSGFTMPAKAISKTAYATPKVYNIVYHLSGADLVVPSNPETYTIETPAFTLDEPERTYSDFAGWIGGVDGGAQLATGTKNLQIGPNYTGHRTYTATWTCHDGFKENLTKDACIPRDDTEYIVRHIQKSLTGTNVKVRDQILTGTTLSGTNAQPVYYTGFQAPATGDIVQGIITGNMEHKTVVDIVYTRLNYNTTVTSTSGVTVTHVGQYDDKNGNVHPHHQYGDTVTITATTGAGYTFAGWEVKDASGHDVTTLVDASATTTTFTMPASAVTIKANTTANPYTIYMDPNGGTIAGGNTITYTVQSEDFNLPTPTRDNSVFSGWKATSGTTTPTEATNPLTITEGSVGDRRYEAVWGCETGYTLGDDECVANTYKVTVDTMDGENGGVSSGETLTFTYGTSTIIPNPTQSGYTFAGWDVSGYDPDTATVDGDPLVSPTSGTEFENLTPTSGGTVTLTALWTPDPDTQYVVNYYVKDLGHLTYTLTGTITGHAETNTGIILATEAARKSYSGFKYSSGYVGVGNETRPTAGDVLETTVDKYGNTVINLYYDRINYTVTLSGDANVAHLTWTGAKAFEYGAEVNAEATPKPGYHFVRWDADPEP